MSWRRKGAEEPRVDLTPMVDVVFLLLIFFMISTTFVESPGLSVDLPESGAQRQDREPEEVKIYLAADGVISLGEEQVEIATLERRLQDYGDRSGAMTFVLLADKQARHGRVVELMDLAREAGFGKLAIATEAKPGRNRPPPGGN